LSLRGTILDRDILADCKPIFPQTLARAREPIRRIASLDALPSYPIVNCFCAYAASGNATTLPIATKNSRLFIRIPGSRLGILSLRAKPGEAANIWPAGPIGPRQQFAFARLWECSLVAGELNGIPGLGGRLLHAVLTAGSGGHDEEPRSCVCPGGFDHHGLSGLCSAP